MQFLCQVLLTVFGKGDASLLKHYVSLFSGYTVKPIQRRTRASRGTLCRKATTSDILWGTLAADNPFLCAERERA